MDNNKIILASKSPRRKYLLEQAGLNFSVIVSNIDENQFSLDLLPSDYVKKISMAKAQNIGEKYPDKWILAADTIVYINGKILGKPSSKNHASEMLNQLQNTVHQVVTGYTILNINNDVNITESVITDVFFKKLTEEEIKWYLQTNEPYDKAGSYAIQGLGTFLVKSVKGSYTNVVGLPVCEVIEALINAGAIKRINERPYYE